jgi:hypothetical protein
MSNRISRDPSNDTLLSRVLGKVKGGPVHTMKAHIRGAEYSSTRS